MPNGRQLVFVGQERDRYGLYVQDFTPGLDSTSTRRALVGFDGAITPEYFTISPDAGRLVIADWEQVSNLMIAEGVPGLDRP